MGIVANITLKPLVKQSTNIMYNWFLTVAGNAKEDALKNGRPFTNRVARELLLMMLCARKPYWKFENSNDDSFVMVTFKGYPAFEVDYKMRIDNIIILVILWELLIEPRKGGTYTVKDVSSVIEMIVCTALNEMDVIATERLGIKKEVNEVEDKKIAEIYRNITLLKMKELNTILL